MFVFLTPFCVPILAHHSLACGPQIVHPIGQRVPNPSSEETFALLGVMIQASYQPAEHCQLSSFHFYWLPELTPRRCCTHPTLLRRPSMSTTIKLSHMLRSITSLQTVQYLRTTYHSHTMSILLSPLFSINDQSCTVLVTYILISQHSSPTCLLCVAAE